MYMQEWELLLSLRQLKFFRYNGMMLLFFAMDVSYFLRSRDGYVVLFRIVSTEGIRPTSCCFSPL